MAETAHYRVLVYEVPRPAKPVPLMQEPAYVVAPKTKELPSFGIDARSPDHAMAAARKWLEDRGHSIKGASFCELPETKKLGIVTYVYAP